MSPTEPRVSRSPSRILKPSVFPPLEEVSETEVDDELRASGDTMDPAIPVKQSMTNLKVPTYTTRVTPRHPVNPTLTPPSQEEGDSKEELLWATLLAEMEEEPSRRKRHRHQRKPSKTKEVGTEMERWKGKRWVGIEMVSEWGTDLTPESELVTTADYILIERKSLWETGDVTSYMT